eukprot:1137150-Pelagomonas_calceolata.AAC.2
MKPSFVKQAAHEAGEHMSTQENKKHIRAHAQTGNASSPHPISRMPKPREFSFTSSKLSVTPGSVASSTSPPRVLSHICKCVCVCVCEESLKCSPKVGSSICIAAYFSNQASSTTGNTSCAVSLQATCLSTDAWTAERQIRQCSPHTLLHKGGEAVARRLVHNFHVQPMGIPSTALAVKQGMLQG